MAAKQEKSLLSGLVIIIALALLMAIAGFLFLSPPPESLEGQVEASSVRISGMLPGRVEQFYVTEGERVHTGDTLVRIHSSVAQAKLYQAQAMESAAAAQNAKVDAGTRTQIVQGAYDLWQQAIAARTIAMKTRDRMQSLFSKGVISEQKRDEAEAAFQAADAAEKAAKSQYDLAVAGAQREDRESARSMVDAARGGVMEVEAVLKDQYLTAPCDGEIGAIYPHEGELIALGAPVMNLLKMHDKWITFNVREQLLADLPMGKVIDVKVPALRDTIIPVEIYYISPLGSYATWRATKATGTYDSRTFEIKARPLDSIPALRPGMSIIHLRTQ